MTKPIIPKTGNCLLPIKKINIPEIYKIKKYYKINFNSDLLWKIHAVLRMKQLYPLLNSDFTNKGNIELYKFGTEHYEKQLRIQAK